MLRYSLDGDVLEVVQETYSFYATKREYWYYDIKQWLVSSHGRQGDKPDRQMDARSIEWVVQNYLPKVIPVPTVELEDGTEIYL